MIKKGDFKMPSKLLDRDETLAANSLRTISQKSLVELVTNFDKLGLIVNNSLSIAMLSWDNYEELVDLIQNQNDKIEELESLFEDIQLAQLYGEDVTKVENGENRAFEVDNVDELFDLLD